MRVVHIITRLILGGAQENTVLNCRDLMEQYGDEVLLVTGPPLGPEGSLIEQAREWKVPLRVLPSLRRSIHPWRDLVGYREIKRTLQEFQPNVVHTHSAKAGLLGRAAAWKLRVPAIVHTVHGAPFHPYQNAIARWFFKSCERWAGRRCHAMISVADAMTRLMVEAAVAPADKFTTIYSGMDVEPFLRAREHRQRVRKELGFKPDDIVIGKVARLFRLKGHDDVLAAFAPLAREMPGVRLLFVGDGIFRERLARLAASLGVGDRVHFTGMVSPRRTAELIGGMDLVVHASLREGLARVLPQALIAGLPVVSYDVDGAREVVIDGETGFLIQPRDIEGLTAALRRLIVDPQLQERLGSEGRARFTDVFRHEQMTRQVRALYERLLDR